MEVVLEGRAGQKEAELVADVAQGPSQEGLFILDAVSCVEGRTFSATKPTVPTPLHLASAVAHLHQGPELASLRS